MKRLLPRFKIGAQLLCRFKGKRWLDFPAIVVDIVRRAGVWEYHLLACSGLDRAFRLVAPERWLKRWKGAPHALYHA